MSAPAPLPPEPAPAARGSAFPELGRLWTAANGLTAVRILTIPFIAWMVYNGGPIGPMFGLLLFAIATDFFDGRLARWSGTVSEWGKVLDPTADKLAAAAVTLALVLRPEAHGPPLPVWFVAAVIVRDTLIAVGGLVQTKRLGFVMMALWSGKVAVTFLAFTVLGALLQADPAVMTALVWATTAALVYSLGRYLQRFLRVMRLGPAVPLDARHRVVRERLPANVPAPGAPERSAG